jgi:hypothetical protein
MATLALRVLSGDRDGLQFSVVVRCQSSTFTYPLTFGWWLDGQWFYTLTIASAAGDGEWQTQLNFTCSIYGN